MLAIRRTAVVTMTALALVGVACETTVTTSLLDGSAPSGLPSPDGIDPRNPNIERSSSWIDFDGIESIRLELPTGRVEVSQSDGSVGGMLKVTEFIAVEGLGYEVLSMLHTRSGVTAERSFVDDARLDIEATVAEGLADTDIIFDVRLVIPNGANIEIFLANGPVEVSEVSGNVEVRTANGQVVLDHVDGNVVAQTSGRPISVIDVTGSVEAQTSDADITLRLAPPPGGLVSARTTQGEIRLTISETTAASLSLTAPDGVVAANLSGFEVTNIATAGGFLGGILNKGGGRIEAHAAGGEITFAGM